MTPPCRCPLPRNGHSPRRSRTWPPSLPRYNRGAQHEGEWVESVDDLADLNARQLATLATTDTNAVAERLRTSLAELGRRIARFGDQQPVFTFHGGQKISADGALGILLCELVVHGHDIARAPCTARGRSSRRTSS